MIKSINVLFDKIEDSFLLFFIKNLFLCMSFAFLEIAGVFMLLPIMGLMLTGELDGRINEYVRLITDDEIVIYIVLLSALVVRVLLSNFVVALQMGSVYSLLSKINAVIYKNGLKKIDGSVKEEEIVQIGMTESNNVAVGYIMPSIRSVSELLTIIGAVFISIKLAPYTFLILFLLLTLTLLPLSNFWRQKLKGWGKERIPVEENRLSYLSAVPRSSIEVAALKIFDSAVTVYRNILDKSMRLGRLQQTLKGQQKNWIELVFVVSVGFIGSLSIINDSIDVELKENGLLIGIFLIKILPSINRITTYINSMNYFSASIGKVNNYLDQSK